MENNMEHLGTKKLETERLILKCFTINDAENMFKNWASDNEVTKYLTWPTHSDVNVSKYVLEQWIQNYGKSDFYNWAIVLKEINEPIGSIGTVKQSDDIKMVHIGYCIGRNWWNKGIISEALTALIKFFFEEVGINRIEARHDPNNPNSGKVMLKCGMKYEGHMKQADKNNQGIVDTIYYAVIADDYFKK
jgi:ribosomal-protein-alanine N-acetyltransferase